MSHKSTRISASVTPEEYNKLKELSTRARMPIGQYIVRAAIAAAEADELDQAKRAPKKPDGPPRRRDGTLYHRDPNNLHDYSWLNPGATVRGVNEWIKAYCELDPFMRKEPYIQNIDKCRDEVAYRKASGLPLYYTEWPKGAEPDDPSITGPVYEDPHLGEPQTDREVLRELFGRDMDKDE